MNQFKIEIIKEVGNRYLALFTFGYQSIGTILEATNHDNGYYRIVGYRDSFGRCCTNYLIDKTYCKIIK